jgi:hypothetical protein
MIAHLFSNVMTATMKPLFSPADQERYWLILVVVFMPHRTRHTACDTRPTWIAAGDRRCANGVTALARCSESYSRAPRVELRVLLVLWGDRDDVSEDEPPAVRRTEELDGAPFVSVIAGG